MNNFDKVFSDFKKHYEAPRPNGRDIFSLLLRRERNPSEAEISSHLSPGLHPWFSAKGDRKIPLESFGKNPYKVLVSTLLSSRTKDEVTLKAAKRLFTKAKNLEQLGQLDIRSIERLIYPVGFYRTKANHLKRLAGIIINEFGGGIPSTREQLMRLPGVGRKTANLVLNRAFGTAAIAVDTHVHKISNMLGWVKTKTPEQTEMELIKILPKKYWSEINRLFVSIGRQFTTQKKLKEFLKKG